VSSAMKGPCISYIIFPCFLKLQVVICKAGLTHMQKPSFVGSLYIKSWFVICVCVCEHENEINLDTFSLSSHDNTHNGQVFFHGLTRLKSQERSHYFSTREIKRENEYI
jgi:hypothetical protein